MSSLCLWELWVGMRWNRDPVGPEAHTGGWEKREGKELHWLIGLRFLVFNSSMNILLPEP